LPLSIGGSGQESETCGEASESATSVESGRSRISCSNVANAIAEALAAIKAGRVDIAREGLEALLERVRAPEGAPSRDQPAKGPSAGQSPRPVPPVRE
jgi:hypothetical protein